VEKHELAPTAEPGEDHPDDKAQGNHRDSHRHNPVEIILHVISSALDHLPDVRAVAVVLPGHVDAIAATLAEVRQPGAEADDKPFAGIERAKQQLFGPIDRLLDRQL